MAIGLSKAMTNKWKDPAYRAMMVKAHVDSWKTSKTRKNYYKGIRKYWSKLENHLKHSRVVKKIWRREGFRSSHKGCRPSPDQAKRMLHWHATNRLLSRFGGVKLHTIKGGTIFCQGSYDKNYNEIMFAHMLDASSRVVRFGKDCIRIPYVWEDTVHTYFPDFVVEMTDGKTYIFEVKGKYICWKDFAKANSAELYCKYIGWKYVLLSPDQTSDEDSMIDVMQKYL